ncbi:MauE/DoxX family redox-associated membrane protein [Ornithinicoccus hortensis]|uniref:Methylamine utilization protein MauE n=1 Tax=Ornithinicoccus hortensis TaxID=82346 RepID=A0A542YSI9_9MICO|nr:MauE/DoxX family redox-associated membrane protein [Ornithinicoccus hortensis]TQL51063.1 methylamine utilization protein MauE [Ornithinicoccus hortensis]
MNRDRALGLVGLVARLLLGGVLLVAGWLKVRDLTGSAQSVVAYELFPYEISRMVGTMLPVLEIALGLLLILGLFTRVSAALGGLLMIVFIAGIVSAWARGLSIDCGCFGTGGPVTPGQEQYLPEILRDLGLAVAAGWLVVRPGTPWALDALLPQSTPSTSHTERIS